MVPHLYPASHLRLLTDKSVVREGEIPHPTPKWSGEGDRNGGIEI